MLRVQYQPLDRCPQTEGWCVYALGAIAALLLMRHASINSKWLSHSPKPVTVVMLHPCTDE